MDDIARNLEAVYKGIARATQQAGRKPESVTLIAVSKTKPVELIRQAIAAGQLDFGENYAQEMRDKTAEIDDPEVRWHFIGHLQTNKVKYLARSVSLIHSVDSLKLAREISKRAQTEARDIEVLIELNLGSEATKTGIESAKAEELIRSVAGLENIKVCGLMTMPPFFADPEDSRPFYRQLRQIRDELQNVLGSEVDLSRLSMGMSHDYEVAIAEGATLVRVGTAIFGERSYKQK